MIPSNVTTKQKNTFNETLDPDFDSQRHLHELQVYKIELEMQNEELQYWFRFDISMTMHVPVVFREIHS